MEMVNGRLPLSRPYFDGEELDELASVINSGWVSRGPKCREFEKAVEEFLGGGPDPGLFCVAVSSCTAALHLALLALEVGRGDEVIVPDYTFPATAMAVMYAGARPVFVDVREDTYCIDPDEIRRALTPRTKAIIPVHLFGHPADMDPILRIAEDDHLYVVEDAACALGAEYRGRKAGTMGDVGCFSLHGRKVITTGEGGFLVTRDSGIAGRARSLSQFGISGAWERSRGEDFQVPVFEILGYNFKMSDIQAAVGVAQMRKLGRIIEYRTGLARKWSEGLAGFDGLRLPEVVGDVRHAWQSYVLAADNRDEVFRWLRQSGAEVGIGTYSCLEQPLFRAYERLECPRSRDLFYRGVSMPMPWGIHIERI